MSRKRVLALVIAAGAFFVAGAVAIPATAAVTSVFAVVKGPVTPLLGTDGKLHPDYSNQTTIWVYRGRVLAVSTAALHCDAAITSCRVDTPPSMWTDAVKGLDPQAARATQVPGGIDALDYDDRGGAAEGKPRLIDMYKRSLRAAMAKAGL